MANFNRLARLGSGPAPSTRRSAGGAASSRMFGRTNGPNGFSGTKNLTGRKG